MRLKSLLSVILIGFCVMEATAQKSATAKQTVENEIIYHVVQRSFYDTNGDHQGDLKGLREKLDYLKDLGVTTLLLLPLYESEFYHNYFATDFEKIDPEFGTMKDYLDLVQAVHAKGMKIYLDMETQYVTEDHLWYKDAVGHPESKYTDYLLFNGPGNTQPESIVWGVTELKGYNGVVRKITTVNLKSKQLLDYNYKLFHYFMDPNGDGKFDDGVDGFRLDHMMDDLDGKEKLKGLFSSFWVPLLTALHKDNPKLIITAEQANGGSFGFDYLEKADVDRVFAFRLLLAIASLDKNKIGAVADSTFSLTPKTKQQVVFLENHDVQRFATTAKGDPGKLRIAASMNLLLGGIPAIYYGQELGMTGSGGFNKFGVTDANDIPQREAFEWYAEIEGKGLALWYKNTGPWWDQTNLKANDGISVEEEKKDPNSLLNYYKKLLVLRKNHSALNAGIYKTIANDNNKVLSFMRSHEDEKILIAINLSEIPQTLKLDLTDTEKSKKLNLLFGNASTPAKLTFQIPAYGTLIWLVK